MSDIPKQSDSLVTSTSITPVLAPPSVSPALRLTRIAELVEQAGRSKQDADEEANRERGFVNNDLLTGARFYLAALRGVVPPEWQEFANQIDEADARAERAKAQTAAVDPDFEFYRELHTKFGGVNPDIVPLKG